MSSYKTVPSNGGHQLAAPDPDPNKSPPTHRFPWLHTKKGIAGVVAIVLVIIGAGLAGLAALPKHREQQSSGGSGGGAGGTNSQITDDEYFYGQSPAVYPSREWSQAFQIYAE
jgi:beta-glucosidase